MATVELLPRHNEEFEQRFKPYTALLQPPKFSERV